MYVIKIFNRHSPCLTYCGLGGGVTLDLGIYAIAMASLVFEGSRPESIQANGYLTNTGLDELASVTIKYPGTLTFICLKRNLFMYTGNRVAHLCYSINLKIVNNAQLCGRTNIAGSILVSHTITDTI